MTTFQSAPPAKADTGSKGGSHFYGYTKERGFYPLYEEGGSFTLSQAKELRDQGQIVVPSVTGYISVMRKYQIEQYAQKAAARAGRDIPMADYPSEDDWLDAVLAKAQSASRGAMDLGTRVHKAVENFINGQDIDADMAPYADAVMANIREVGIADGLVAEEVAGSLEYGAAGKFDLVHEGTMTIGDIKTRGHKLNKKKPSRVPSYETDEIQVAAGGFFKWGNKFFIRGRGIIFATSTVQPGLVTVHQFAGRDLIPAFETFIALSAVWRFVNGADFRVKGGA